MIPCPSICLEVFATTALIDCSTPAAADNMSGLSDICVGIVIGVLGTAMLGMMMPSSDTSRHEESLIEAIVAGLVLALVAAAIVWIIIRS